MMMIMIKMVEVNVFWISAEMAVEELALKEEVLEVREVCAKPNAIIEIPWPLTLLLLFLEWLWSANDSS
jgi:hypothetical protein